MQTDDQLRVDGPATAGSAETAQPPIAEVKDYVNLTKRLYWQLMIMMGLIVACYTAVLGVYVAGWTLQGGVVLLASEIATGLSVVQLLMVMSALVVARRGAPWRTLNLLTLLANVPTLLGLVILIGAILILAPTQAVGLSNSLLAWNALAFGYIIRSALRMRREQAPPTGQERVRHIEKYHRQVRLLAWFTISFNLVTAVASFIAWSQWGYLGLLCTGVVSIALMVHGMTVPPATARAHAGMPWAQATRPVSIVGLIALLVWTGLMIITGILAPQTIVFLFNPMGLFNLGIFLSIRAARRLDIDLPSAL